MKPKIILHADDFGLNKSFNSGIIESYKSGYLTSTCLRTNGSAFDEAVSAAKGFDGLGIGVHLNIVEGKTNRQVKKNELLCSSDGMYRLSFIPLWRHLLSSRKKELLNEIEADFRNQIETVLSRGIHPDHLNSHQHVHAIPPIFELVCKLAYEYKIPFVRMPREVMHLYKKVHKYLFGLRWYIPNLAKFVALNSLAVVNTATARRYGIKTNDLFLGILHSGNMNMELVKRGLSRIRNNSDVKIVEVLFHPSLLVATNDENYIPPSLREYVINPARAKEIQTLIDRELPYFIEKMNFEFSNYSFLSGRYTVEQRLKNRKNSSSQKYKYRASVFVVIDETPFFHPDYIFRLLNEGKDFYVCGAAIVKFPAGGVLQKYLLRNIFNLGLWQFIRLGVKKYLLKSKGYLHLLFQNRCHGSVEKILKNHGIPYKVISSAKDRKLYTFVKSFSPDIILSSSSLLFTESMINIPKIACINRHSSLLPSYGGIFPVFRAIQFGKRFTGASVHHMVKELDKGGVISRKYVPIFKKDSLYTLYKLCFTVSFEATIEAISKVIDNPKYTIENNDGNIESYYSYPTKSDWKEFKNQGGHFI